MMVVYKYPLLAQNDFVIMLQKGAKILHVEMQHGKPQMWVLQNPNASQVQRHFMLVATGEPRDDIEGAEFVGTFLAQGGVFVFHLFVRPEEKV